MKTIVTKKIAGNGRPARRAFTLIELLTVIAIIGVLAALLFPAFSGVNRQATLNRAKAEMAQLETAIDRYKAAYGFYPPGNGNASYPAINQLYYELTGTTNLPNGAIETLDGNSQITPGAVGTVFNVGGFMNCDSTNASAENSPVARNFLPGLKPNQIGAYTTNGVTADLIVSSIDWPTAATAPTGAQAQNNPWRYNSSNPANNPGAYDLWLQIVIKPGQTNLICNWSKQVQINSPLP